MVLCICAYIYLYRDLYVQALPRNSWVSALGMLSFPIALALLAADSPDHWIFSDAPALKREVQ